MTLERTVAPTTLPITKAEVKAQMIVDHTDDDDYIDSLIDAAVAYVDGTGVLGRAMVTQTWRQWVSNAPGYVRLAMGPFQSLTEVEYYDADGALQTATLADFETRKDGDFVIVKPKDGKTWPAADARHDAIAITYVAGFGDEAADVPATIRAALKLLVAHWYQNREAVSAQDMSEIPLGFNALIGVERVGWYG